MHDIAHHPEDLLLGIKKKERLFLDAPDLLEWAYGKSNHDLSSTQRSVLAYLAFRQNGKTGEGCSASIRRIAEDTGFAQSTVRDAIRALESMGRVTTEARWRPKAEHNRDTNSYQCAYPNGVHREPVGGTPTGGGGVHREPVPNRNDEQEDEPSSPPTPPDGGAESVRSPGGGEPRRRAPKKPSPPEAAYRSPWIERWNRIRETVAPDAPAARRFPEHAEKSLIQRGAEIGLSEEALEAAIEQQLPLVGDFMRPRVTLLWLATGQKAGLSKFVEGEYADPKRAAQAERLRRERDAPNPWVEEKRLQEEAREFLRSHGITPKY